KHGGQANSRHSCAWNKERAGHPHGEGCRRNTKDGGPHHVQGGSKAVRGEPRHNIRRVASSLVAMARLTPASMRDGGAARTPCRPMASRRKGVAQRGRRLTPRPPLIRQQ